MKAGTFRPLRRPQPRRARWVLRALVLALLAPAGLLLALWTFGAIRFDGPFGARGNLALGIAWLLAVVAALWSVRPGGRKVLALLALGLLVWLPWLVIPASNGRDWKPEVARAPHAEIAGDLVTIHDLRDFDWLDGGRVTERWETRRVRLSELRGIDLFLTHWGSPWIAHPIVSFDFGPDGHVAFSIETRPERGEEYSAVAGFFKQFELIYVVADERDVVRLRTNHREGEDVYLYALTFSPERARGRFIEYLARVNELHAHPEFYNALTDNCTTSIRAQHTASDRAPLDWRILLNGKMDEWLGELGVLRAKQPFPELKQRVHINPQAHAADRDPAFSERIRAGVPGF
jgi:hypothetical protein